MILHARSPPRRASHAPGALGGSSVRDRALIEHVENSEAIAVARPSRRGGFVLVASHHRRLSSGIHTAEGLGLAAPIPSNSALSYPVLAVLTGRRRLHARP